jgi:polygalacturonase
MSNVTIAFNGATVTGSGTIDGAETDSQIATQYPNCQDDGHMHWHNALIWGENVSNVAFVGPGTLNGVGLDTNAQKLIAFKNSDVVLFDNLTMSNTGHFAFLMTNVTNLTMSRLTVTPSRDGVDLMECSNVNAHDLSITGGNDDAFALKSDCTVGTPITTNNVTVSNSTFGSNCNAMQIGSETWGDFQNITWSNNKIINGGKSGIGIQMNDGAVIRNVVYDHINVSGTSFPIFMSVTSLLRAGKTVPGHAENILFANITGSKPPGSSQTSAPNSVIVVSGESGHLHQGVVFRNVNMTFAGGGSGSTEPPEGSTFTDGTSATYNPRYITPLPAYGAYVRHANGVEFHGVTFSVGSDSRPAVFARDVGGLLFDTFSAPKAGSSLLNLNTVSNLTFENSPPLADGTVASVSSATY